MAEEGQDASRAAQQTDVTFTKQALHWHNRGKQKGQLFLIMWILQLGIIRRSKHQNSFCKACTKDGA